MRAWRVGTALVFLIAVAAIPIQPAHAASNLQFGTIQYNAPGTDTATNASVNGEYFTVKNISSVTKDLFGVTVRDAQSHVYHFTTHFTLAAHAYVRVHTGKGTNTATTRYWGLGYHVWNNTGDTATMRNSAGAALDSCRWTSSGAGYTRCP